MAIGKHIVYDLNRHKKQFFFADNRPHNYRSIMTICDIYILVDTCFFGIRAFNVCMN
jgi:hypothetical protein